MTRSSTSQRTESRSSPGADSSSAKHGEAPSPAPFAWRSWPIVDEWRRIWPVAVAVALVAIVIGVATGKLELALLAMAVQAVALWRIWVPIQYEINAHGIEQRILGRRSRVPWTAVGRHALCNDGVILFRDAERRPFDSWRGVYLPWIGHREDVVAALARIMHGDERN